MGRLTHSLVLLGTLFASYQVDNLQPKIAWKIPAMSFLFLGIQDVAGAHLALLLYGVSWFIGTTCGDGCGSGLNHGRGGQGVPGRHG